MQCSITQSTPPFHNFYFHSSFSLHFLLQISIISSLSCCFCCLCLNILCVCCMQKKTKNIKYIQTPTPFERLLHCNQCNISKSKWHRLCWCCCWYWYQQSLFLQITSFLQYQQMHPLMLIFDFAHRRALNRWWMDLREGVDGDDNHQINELAPKRKDGLRVDLSLMLLVHSNLTVLANPYKQIIITNA